MATNSERGKRTRQRWADMDHKQLRVYVHKDIVEEAEKDAKKKNEKYLKKLSNNT